MTRQDDPPHADRWLPLLRQLQGLASTGSHFAKDPFDVERYGSIANVAHTMLGLLGARPPEVIAGLFDDFATGYATPRIDVRGALIVDDRILLAREIHDGRWSLPGGYADIGLSPKENLAKEFREEAGLTVEVQALYAIRHKARHAYEPDAREFYKLFFLCACTSAMTPAAGLEMSDVGFFDLGNLPPLSTGRVIHADIEAAFAFRDGRQTVPLID